MISVELVQKGDRLRVGDRASGSGRLPSCTSVGEARREDASRRCGAGGTVHGRRVTHNRRVHASIQATRYHHNTLHTLAGSACIIRYIN